MRASKGSSSQPTQYLAHGQVAAGLVGFVVNTKRKLPAGRVWWRRKQPPTEQDLCRDHWRPIKTTLPQGGVNPDRTLMPLSPG